MVGAGTLLPIASQAGAQAATSPLSNHLVKAPSLAPTQAQQAPSLDIRTSLPGTAPGLLFLTAQGFFSQDAPRGPQIMDGEGNTIWFHQIPSGTFSADFRVQTYQGEKVLTWWEGTAGAGGIGSGVGYIANSNYEIIATVTTPDAGESLDLHEFLITPEDTAVVISYRDVPTDLSPVGGPTNGMAYDCVVQEIDIASGQSVRDWHSMEHVSVTESDFQYQQGSVFDYMHVNGVSLDTDGNLIVTARHADAIFKVDRMTGEVIWRLGGVGSDFTFGAGAQFIGHHDGQGEGDNIYRVFDNATHGAPGPESRVVRLELDEEAGTAELIDEIRHPDVLTAIAEGNAQRLPNGNTLVSWGQASRISEFSPTGELLFDGALAQGTSSYRAYRLEWDAQPATGPEVAVDRATGEIHAVWPGATGVASWRVLTDDSSVSTMADQPYQGFDTVLALPESVRGAQHIRIQALNKQGEVLGTSHPTGLSSGRSKAR